MVVDSIQVRVIDGARQAVERFGWQAATLERIAEEAGLSRMTLHRHGLGRDEIFSLLGRGLRARLPGRRRGGVRPARHGCRAARRGLAAVCDASERHLSFLRGLDEEADTRLFHEQGVSRAGYVSPIEQVIRDGIDERSFRRVPVPSTATLSSMPPTARIGTCGSRTRGRRRGHDRPSTFWCGASRPPPHDLRLYPQTMMIRTIDELEDALQAADYLPDRGLSTALFLAITLEKPLLLEGEAGVGKTEAAKSLATALGARLLRLQCYEGLDVAQHAARARRRLDRAERCSRPPCIALIRHGPAGALIRARGRGMAGATREFFAIETSNRLNDPLLQALMTVTVVCSADLEKFLTACRFALLQATETTALDPLLGFACALAHQCHNNEYVYATAGDEEERARALDCAIGWRPRWPAARTCHRYLSRWSAAYCPLHEITVGRTFCWRDPWPDTGQCACSTRQVREPREEAALRDTLPATHADRGHVSVAVRAQYEVNPYPRWVGSSATQRSRASTRFLREGLSAASLRAHGQARGPDILVAGCGTGQRALVMARQFGCAQCWRWISAREPRLRPGAHDRARARQSTLRRPT